MHVVVDSISIGKIDKLVTDQAQTKSAPRADILWKADPSHPYPLFEDTQAYQVTITPQEIGELFEQIRPVCEPTDVADAWSSWNRVSL